MTRVCADCTVRHEALCGSLDDTELLDLHRLGRRRLLERGETLSWAGEADGLCANLLSGVLKVSACTADGREQIVGLCYPADFVGSPFADTSHFTVSALTEAEVCVFPRGAFEGLLAVHGRMERLLLQRTFAALDDTRGRLLVLSRNTAEQKVAGFISNMAERARGTDCRAHADGPATFDLPLTRGQIADVLGLTIETVSRQLTRLKTAGILALPGVRAVTVRDAAALRARAGID